MSNTVTKKNGVITPASMPRIGKLMSRPKTFTYGIFGESGSGKTTLSTTVVDNPDDLLIVNIDNSISVLPDDYNVFPDPSEGRPVETWDELLELVSWLEVEGHKHFKAVSFDTLTEAGARLLKNDILSRPPRIGSRPSKDRMNQDDYGQFADSMLSLISRLRDLPMNVVLLMQTRDLEVDSPDGQTELYRFPSFGEGKKVSSEANQYLDMVGYLSVVVDTKNKSISHNMLVYPVGNRKAKIRTRPGITAPVVFSGDELNLSVITKKYMLEGDK